MDYFNDTNIIGGLMYLELDKIKPSKTHRILGISMVIFSIPSFILKPLFDGNLVVNGLYSLFLFLAGINGFVQGKGKSITTFFGKRYIDITEANVRIKMKTFKEEFSFEWAEIQSLHISPLSIEFVSDEGRKKLPLDYLDYKTVCQIKEVVLDFSNRNNIQIT